MNHKTKLMTKKILVFSIILLLELTILPTISGDYIKKADPLLNNSIYTAGNTNQELDLLHGNTYFNITCQFKDVTSFNITYTIPPNYEYQAPLFFDIRDDTTANVISYSMSNDTNPPNKVVTFKIGSMKKWENALLHLEYWVLVKNNDYNDLPGYVEMPTIDELPEETKIWLTSTKPIQSNNTLIKIKAKQLLRKSNSNLRNLADQIVKFTLTRGYYLREISHKYNLNLIRMIRIFLDLLFITRITSGGWPHYNDALGHLLFRIGSCTGDANLGTALFRANNVPAKDLIVMPANGIRYNVHYICEYYCPDYGWVLAETSQTITPYMPKEIIILRVNYPEDENIAGTGFDYYGGCEQWHWIDNENVIGYARTRTYNKNTLITSSSNANISFEFTQKVWEKFTQYAGLPLSGENQDHFDNATKAQEDALTCFLQSNINGYMENITYAFAEYEKIIL